MGFIRNLTGSTAARRGRRAAQEARLGDFSFEGVGGGGASFDTETGIANINLGDLEPFREQLLSAFGPQFQQGTQSINGQVSLDGNPFAAAANQRLQGAGRDFGGLAAERLQQLRSTARPMETRAANSLADRLFSQGRLGTTGGAQLFGDLAQRQETADIQRQVASTNFAATQQERDVNASNTLLSGALAGAALDERNIGRQQLERDSAFARAFGGLEGAQGLEANAFNQFNAGLNASVARSNADLGVATGILNAEQGRTEALGNLVGAAAKVAAAA